MIVHVRLKIFKKLRIRIGNAFALTRPPGHHSYANSPQGFCIYNNVAIAAKYAIEHLGIKKVRNYFNFRLHLISLLEVTY